MMAEDVLLYKALILRDPVHPSQLVDDDTYFNYGGDVIEPVYDPLEWSKLFERSARLAQAVRARARNTVGLGVRVEPVRPLELLSKEDREVYEQEAEVLNDFIEDANPEVSFEEVLECAVIDEQLSGDGWIEVPRDKRGLPRRLYHASSPSMRIGLDKTPAGNQLLVQRRLAGTVTRYFRPFGDPSSIDPETGKGAKLPWNKRSSEIIHFRTYTPLDDWYGAPRHAPALQAIVSSILGKQSNVNFIRNLPRIPAAVIAEGAGLTAESRKSLTDLIQHEGKGVQNAGRLLVLEPELENIPPALRQNVRIRIEKLSMGVTEDGSFQEMRKLDDEEVREAVGIPKLLLGTFDDANKSNSVIALRIAVQQEFEPEIHRKEFLINRTIVRGLGLRFARVHLVRPKILDALQDAALVQKLMVGYSVNDLRAVISQLRGERLEPVDHPLAQIPLAFFKDPKMLAAAEVLVDEAVTTTRPASRPTPEVLTAPPDFLPAGLRGLMPREPAEA